MARGDKRTIYGVEVTEGEDGLYRDALGTIYALADDSSSVDDTVRCGVGIASLPADSELTAACAPHDFKTSSPAYQRFHNRSEAEADLRRDLGLVATRWYNRLLAPVLATISSATSWKFWEWAKTRWK